MNLFAHDLAIARTIYGDRERGKEPEMIVKLQKGAPVVIVGDRVTLTNSQSNYGEPTAQCEADVIAIAAVVRPDWTTYSNPHAEARQESLM